MIATITGTLTEATPVNLIVTVSGLGYEVHCPVTTTERLPHPGQEVKLYTKVVYREDSQDMYGFYSREDRDFFKLLTEKVSGIGPKTALSIMSKLSVPMLQQAIVHEDVALLAKCPGIGKKTAERLVVELKDQLAKGGIPQAGGTGGGSASGSSGGATGPAGGAPGDGGSAYPDAVTALITLGYKPAVADNAVRKAMNDLGNEASVEDLIKRALG